MGAVRGGGSPVDQPCCRGDHFWSLPTVFSSHLLCSTHGVGLDLDLEQRSDTSAITQEVLQTSVRIFK